MSSRGVKDPTASKAIRQVMKWAAAGHARGCWVNGGPHHHGTKGFRCERCADGREEH